MEDSTETKQNYLRQEIIEKKYDPEAFIAFMGGKKENGTDINLWSYQELVEVVKEFKKLNPMVEGEGDEQVPELRHQDTSGTFDYEEQEKITTRYKGSEPLPDIINEEDDKVDFINTKILEETHLTKYGDELQIELMNTEVKSGGIFGKNYILYTVTTAPVGWEVKRRFSDFEWFRNMITKLYPHVYVPPVPPKKASGRFEQKFVEKRRKLLQCYLNSMISSPVLRDSSYVIDFLSNTNSNAVALLKKTTSKLKGPITLEELPTKEGKVYVKFNKDAQTFSKKANIFLNAADSVYKKTIQISKQLVQDSTGVGNTIYQLGDSFKQLHELFKTTGSSNMMEMYSALSELMISWGNAFVNQAKIVQRSCVEFYKFYELEQQAMKELMRTKEEYGDIYFKKNAKLLARKRKIFLQRDVTKWDLGVKLPDNEVNKIIDNESQAFARMLPKETSDVISRRRMYAFYLNNFWEQNLRQINYNFKISKKHFLEMAESYSQNLANLHVEWGNIIGHFQEFNFQDNIGKALPPQVPAAAS